MDVEKLNLNEKSINETDAGSVEKGTLRNALNAWARTLSVESGGIQRVTDEQRQSNTTKVWNACTFWYAYS
jgi:hypothetical protein